MRSSFFCIDAHTCGNPVRLVAGGGPNLLGINMSEKRQHFLKEYDWIRKGLMFEPRGHDMMSGSILYSPHDPANDIAVLFIETSGCLPMCGHGTIGTITAALEHGLITPKVPGKIRMEAPAGLVLIDYIQEGAKVISVKLRNVPSFLHSKGLEIISDYIGAIRFDVAYGGNFYAIIDPQQNFKGLEHHSASELITWSAEIRAKINHTFLFVHPADPTINTCTHIQWTGTPRDPESSGRNAVFYGDKAIDRSPCGTGTSARMAQWAAQGKLQKGDRFIHESIIHSKFTGVVEEIMSFEGYQAIVPSIEGWAQVTGYNTIFIDDDDPYAHGFQVI
jgi:4-hydroxyproline epimerase